MRALAVAGELETRGIPKGIVKVSEMRFLRPLLPTAKGVSAAENRRVVVDLLK
jgi:outer membrane protein OmpA-like peptidoglycan-associated protein